MNDTRFPSSNRLPEGTILEYQLWDDDQHPVARGLTRDEAREYKRECGGYVVKVEVVH